MIEATCAACGTLNRIAEADFPPGAKFVTCASCKSRVALPIRAPLAGSASPKAAVIPPSPSAKTPPPLPGGPALGAKGPSPIDLADLPAPRRASPLAGTEASKPAPRSALNTSDAELPAPKAAARPAGPGPIDLDDLMPAELPTPKGKSATAPSGGVADLPAPKARPPASPPSSIKPSADLGDLPAPKAKASPIADLPAPKAKASPLADLPVPKAATAISDLPAPKARPPATPPKASSNAALADGPAGVQEIIDLPAPRGGITDLPMPKAGANNDLPAPKGFFDDLPQPARNQPPKAPPPTPASAIDLPAPKGFFDDLPQPARPSQQKADLVAPKGFFDDLPQPGKSAPGAPVPAPKGFFDDLPQPTSSTDSKGMFADLPEPTPASAGIDLPSADPFSLGNSLDLELSPGVTVGKPLELEDDRGHSGAELDLGLGLSGGGLAPAIKEAEPMGGLDLSEPSARPGIRISTPSTTKGGKDTPRFTPVTVPKAAGELKLELEGELPGAPPAATASAKAAPKRKQADTSSAEASARTKKRIKLVLGVVVGVALVGAGGFYFYQRHVAAQARADEISEQLGTARAALGKSEPNHWERAASAASAVLELDPTNAEALGIAAESLIAGALDTGINGPARIAQGKQLLQTAFDASVTGPALERAQGLGAIAARQPDRAVTKLQAMVAKNPKDGFLLLYLGWAQVALHDETAAIKSFDQAIAANPNVKLPALYARGRAKLRLADLDGARADFSAVLEIPGAKNHIGAQVGLAAALPPAQAAQRQKDLLAILESKDIAKGDPRAVVLALTLAADDARIAGRLDVARERYSKAIALDKLDVPALTGLAAVELRDGKPEVAEEKIKIALAQSPDDPIAQLVEAEIWLRQGKTPAATGIVTKLAARTPPLPPLQLAHLDVVRGRIFEVQGQDDAAVDAYAEGAKIAGDIDLEPTIAAVTKLSALAKKASEARDEPKAAAYRTHAEQLLSSLAGRAQEDSQLSMTLGVAYLQAGDAAKAENFLRRALEMRANDVETKVELSKALALLGRVDDAIEQLKQAFELDKSRTDIALELARTYESANRIKDAADAYDKLLAAKDVTVSARVHAGRFYARTGDIAKAAAQAAPILAAERENPAGHYLRAEGLLAAGKLDDAAKEIRTAVDSDPDPQYLDAQGRVAEKQLESGDGKYAEAALRAYQRASTSAPNMFNPLAGQGRMFIYRNELTKALPPLIAANKLENKDSGVMYWIGVAYQGLLQKDAAIQWLEASQRNGRREAETFWRLGQLYVDVNNGGQAARSLDEATRLGVADEKLGKQIPWLTEAWYQLGDLDAKLNNLSGAKRALQTFVDRNPPPGARLDQARHDLGTIYKSVP